MNLEKMLRENEWAIKDLGIKDILREFMNEIESLSSWIIALNNKVESLIDRNRMMSF